MEIQKEVEERQKQELLTPSTLAHNEIQNQYDENKRQLATNEDFKELTQQIVKRSAKAELEKDMLAILSDEQKNELSKYLLDCEKHKLDYRKKKEKKVVLEEVKAEVSAKKINALKKRYGYLYKQDENGEAIWPAIMLNYTNKTQFLYKINKGIFTIRDSVKINESMPDSKKRVPFTNMVYFGDGETDVPCMKLVKQSGGHSIALYNPGKHRSAAQLLEQDRVDWMFEADYREGSDLDSTMKLLLENLASYNKLKGLNEQQKREFH